MGCISSKMASKKSRFDGELMDDKLISNPQGNRLVSLLFSSDKVVLKLKSEEQEGKKKLGDILGKLSHGENHDSVNTWELMAGLEEEEEEDEKKKKKRKESLGDRSLKIEVMDVDDFLGSSSDEADEGEDRDGREDSKLKSRTQLVAPGGEVDGAVCRDSFSSDSMRFIVNGDKECRRSGEETREEVREEASSFSFVGVGGHLHGNKAAGGGKEEGETSGDETPTFGSYIRSRVRERMEEAGEVEHDDREGSGGVLHEELMTQLEEAMEQLRDEEEHVVMKIVEDFLDQVHGATCVN